MFGLEDELYREIEKLQKKNKTIAIDFLTWCTKQGRVKVFYPNGSKENKTLVEFHPIKKQPMSKQRTETAEQFLRDKYKLVDFNGLEINGISWLQLMEEYASQFTPTQADNGDIGDILLEYELKVINRKEAIDKINLLSSTQVVVPTDSEIGKEASWRYTNGHGGAEEGVDDFIEGAKWIRDSLFVSPVVKPIDLKPLSCF